MVALALGIAFLIVGVLLGILVDRHRRLQLEIARYHAASHDLLATIDRGGRLIRVNAAWEHALGHRAESMHARELIDFVHRDERATARAELQGALDGSRTADGKYRWLEWEAATSSAKDVIQVVASDITEQRTAQQQLANSARWLEAKVAERTHELDEARAETLQLLAAAVEYRDDHTFQHTERVGLIAAEIAVRLGLRAEQVTRL